MATVFPTSTTNSTSTQVQAAVSGNTSPASSGYQYILAYGVAIMIFMFAIKTRIGYKLFYYLFVLLLLLLLVSESGFIAKSLAPISKNDTGQGLPGVQ